MPDMLLLYPGSAPMRQKQTACLEERVVVNHVDFAVKFRGKIVQVNSKCEWKPVTALSRSADVTLRAD